MAEPPDGAQEDVVETGVSAAARMKAAREAAGMSLNDVAEKTRVPLRHLASLEEGDYDALPGMTYCAGFARAYARAVGLDEAGLVAQMRFDIDRRGGLNYSQYEFEEAVDPARVPPRWIAITATAIALVLAAGYGLWRMQLNTPPTDEQVIEQAALESPEPAIAPTPTPVVPQGPVVMTAADTVWLRIYQPDGTRLYEGTLAQGESYTVPPNARDPMILTGRPDVLAITVGGRTVPPLGPAERTISDVPVSAGALLERLDGPGTGVQGNVSASPSSSPSPSPSLSTGARQSPVTTPPARSSAPIPAARPSAAPPSAPTPGNAAPDGAAANR